jgi:hypothetical protein
MHWRALATSFQPLTEYSEPLIDMLGIPPAIPPSTKGFPSLLINHLERLTATQALVYPPPRKTNHLLLNNHPL